MTRPDATRTHATRGGAPVGQIDQMPAPDACLVRCLRRWCEGGTARDAIAPLLAEELGPRAAPGALVALENLFFALITHAPRPLMRHQVACRCVGADEAHLAAVVAAAGAGAFEDATLFAARLVHPEAAPALVVLGARVATLLHPVTGNGGTAPAPSLTVH